MTHARISDASLRISEEAAQEGSKLVPAGTVLAVVRGMSLANEFRVALTAREVAFNQDVKALVCKDGVDSRFLFYALVARRHHIKELATEASHGTKKLETGVLLAVQIPLPDRETQIRAADIPAAYDDLIENNRRRMALLEESARLLYREWFVRLRFPGHEHTPAVSGIPEGWRRQPLGEIFTLKRGYDLPEGRRVEGQVPIVSSSGITGYHNERRAEAPGVVTGRYGTLGEVYLIQEDYWPLNTALYVSDFKGQSAEFVAHLLRHVLGGLQSDKAAVPGLDRNVVHQIEVLLPPKALRDHFTAFASPIHRQQRLLATSNEKLLAARDGLLHRVMSGEIAA